MSAQRQLVKAAQAWQAVQLSHSANHANQNVDVNRSMLVITVALVVMTMVIAIISIGPSHADS